MRMKGKDGISRALYVTAVGRRVVCGSRVRQENTEDAQPGDRAGSEASKGDFAMSKVSDLHQKWMKSKEYRKAVEELAPEFALARAVIDARVTAGLTQEQLARRMDTTQSVIARLESGRTRPSTQTLERLATATGTHLRISFEPGSRA
jgi:ribosome-binding protein aMBF1 (putative translation factor)